MDLLDADLEVAVEGLMELLDVRRAVLPLLIAEAGYGLEVMVEVDWNCHSVDCHWVVLLVGGLLLLHVGLFPGPRLRLGQTPFLLCLHRS